MLLKDIKVLDLSTLLPGPMCSLFLADLGADVIKVESLKGDLMREVDHYYFSALNRNKKSITLNLKSEHGKKIFMRLAKDADIVIENFRPGKTKALGIGYINVKRINPKVIYCSITGYGQKGAYKDKAGHDLNYSSLSGLIDLMSHKPFVPGVQMADASSALIAAFSIVVSLLHREKTGIGNYIDVSIFNSVLSIIGIHIAHLSLNPLSHSYKKSRTLLSGGKPCYNIYKTKDGRHISLCAIENKFWSAFCNSTNRRDLMKRKLDKSAIKDMRKLFKSKTIDEWVILNKKYDFCCEPVKRIDEILSSSDLKSKKSFIKLDGIKQVAFPVLFSSFNKNTYCKPPKLGEHTNQILGAIGYNKNFIKELRAKGIIL